MPAEGGDESRKRRKTTAAPTERGHRAVLDSVLAQLSPSFLPAEDSIKGMDSRMATVQQLLTRTIDRGESASLLLCGQRGWGKSTAVESVLRSVTQSFGSKCVAVRLNGLLHADEIVCIRTMASALDSATGDVAEGMFTHFEEGLAYIMQKLRALREAGRTAVIVMDEFDMFASAGRVNNSKQTLLYNLFSLLGSSDASIAIVGITVRLDAVDVLEKRVRSRYSHRKILFPKLSFDDSIDAVRCRMECPGEDAAATQWNEAVATLFESAPMRRMLNDTYHRGYNLRHMLDLLSGPVQTLSMALLLEDKVALPTVELFRQAIVKTNADPMSDMVQNLSVLELLLVIAMKRVEERDMAADYSFEAVYSEYAAFAANNRTMESYSKEVCLKAFDHLVDIELVRYTDWNPRLFGPASGASSIRKEFRSVRLMIDHAQLITAVGKYKNCPTVLRQWAGRLQ